ncbi:MAG: right-handed parallel beta-helix repeat-containing protein [Planctomycetota bacterium]|jgi:hypothetical protein
MEKRILTISIIAAVVFALAGHSVCLGECATDIWICQETGTNSPDTQGTPEDPYKSITYALARCDFLGCPEPWCVHIGPGIYDANSTKPAPEREIFPIQLRQGMVFEGADCNDPNDPNADPNTRIIDGRHLLQGLAALVLGQNLTGLQIRNLTFRNMNHSQGNGGAVELVECGGFIENCIIKDNSARSGGGMWLSPRGTPVPFNFIGCTFRNNTASTGPGGAVYVSAALTGNFSNCTFSDNAVTAAANTWGGGLGVNGSLTGDIAGCRFSNNSAKQYGGGGFCVAGNLTGDIARCDFTGNSARESAYVENYGAGFRITGSMTGEISDCNFTDNSTSATYGTCGGGFCIHSTMNGSISECTFTGNSCADTFSSYRSYGGGFYVDRLNGRVSRCQFAQNAVYANADTAAQGGGFYVGTLNDDIAYCNFTANSAEGYGAGFCVSSNLTGNIWDCNFAENDARTNHGGFYVHGNLAGNVADCGFIENAGGDVGGFSVNGRLIGKVKACHFDNGEPMASNRAVLVAGDFEGVMENCLFYDFVTNAVCLQNDNATEAKIRSCLFVAPATLGEVSGWGIETSQKTIISNNTMVGPGVGTGAVPSQPSAIYIGFNTQAENGEIKNNIIVDTQCGIRVDAAVDMPIKYNCFDNINEIVCQGESCLGYDCWWIEWILSNFRHNYCQTDPCFVPGDPIFHIQQASPCVDTGDPNYVSELCEKDIDGQPRVAYCKLDRGADEYVNEDFNDTCWDPNECVGQPCGDATCDGQVNLADLFALKANFGKTPPWTPPECCADFTQDGSINLADLFALKAGFGSGPYCPSTGNQNCPP